jgi:hypothetical protein
MLSSRIPSVKDTCFQHKVLTKIHGEPTCESLQNTSTELKANASSVPSTLGGGQNGHLGLLLSAARCNTLAHAVPWATPVNPGVFVPPNPGTGPQIAAANDVWRELKLQFELCQAADKALIAQLVESMDPVCLRAMLNRATGQHLAASVLSFFTFFLPVAKSRPNKLKPKKWSCTKCTVTSPNPLTPSLTALTICQMSLKTRTRP